MALNPDHSLEEEIDFALDQAYTWSLVLYNDEVNTFEWVIQCLIEICGHTRQQAEQCAWFIHNNGKYKVKSGSIKELEPMCTALCDKGLSAKIED